MIAVDEPQRFAVTGVDILLGLSPMPVPVGEGLLRPPPGAPGARHRHATGAAHRRPH
jgi:hypothetical protein